MPELSRDSFGDEQSYITYLRSLREMEREQRRLEAENKASKKRRGRVYTYKPNAGWKAKSQRKGLSERIRLAYGVLARREERARKLATDPEGFRMRERAYAKAKRDRNPERSREILRRSWHKNRAIRNWEQRQFYSAHREEKLASAKEYYATHREERLAYGRAFYDEHREELNAKSREYYKRNAENQRAYRRAYVQAHSEDPNWVEKEREYRREWQRDYRARMTPEQREEKNQRDRDRRARKKAERLAQQNP